MAKRANPGPFDPQRLGRLLHRDIDQELEQTQLPLRFAAAFDRAAAQAELATPAPGSAFAPGANPPSSVDLTAAMGQSSVNLPDLSPKEAGDDPDSPLAGLFAPLRDEVEQESQGIPPFSGSSLGRSLARKQRQISVMRTIGYMAAAAGLWLGLRSFITPDGAFLWADRTELGQNAAPYIDQGEDQKSKAWREYGSRTKTKKRPARGDQLPKTNLDSQTQTTLGSTAETNPESGTHTEPATNGTQALDTQLSDEGPLEPSAASPSENIKAKRRAKKVRAKGRNELDPSMEERLRGLEKRAQQAWRRGDFAAAVRDYRSIIKLDRTGSFSEPAWGDLLLLARRDKSLKRRREIWREYLWHAPKGRFADDARAGLCRSASKEAASCWIKYLKMHPKGAHRKEALQFQTKAKAEAGKANELGPTSPQKD